MDPVQPGGPGTGGWNHYSYAANNPTTWTDPTGQSVLDYSATLNTSTKTAPVAAAAGVAVRRVLVQAAATLARDCVLDVLLSGTPSILPSLGTSLCERPTTDDDPRPNPQPDPPTNPQPPVPDPDTTDCAAPNTTDPACDLDHIVLGLEAYGLRETAARVGGRHLLDDPNWRYTFLEALGDPSIRFTISLDGLDGADPTEQLRTAVHRGAGGNPSPTNWEIAQLHQVGRLSTTSLVEDRGRTSVLNPWPAVGFPP